jgi:type VI secretion system protein ImpK
MHLIDSFIDTLVFVRSQIKVIDEGQTPDFETLRLGVEKCLTEKSSLHVEGGYQSEHYDLARFAVIAYVDEAVLASGWEHNSLWASDLLQKNYYNTASAGIEFFDRLASLNMIDPVHHDIREVYYYCLSLGFMGRYFDSSDRATLDRIRQDTYQLLMAGQGNKLGDSGKKLSPDAYPPESEFNPEVVTGRWTPYLFGVPVLVVIITYVAMKLDIVGMANQLVSLI